MDFKVKKDNSFMTMILILTIFIVVLVSAPFISFFNNLSALNVVLWVFLLFITVGVLLWTSYGIKYKFYDDYLYIRGGIFRSRIPYNKITQVESLQFTTVDLLAGYRILASKDGIEILYKKGFGTVKISPSQKSLFLSELKKRCPQAKFKNE